MNTDYSINAFSQEPLCCFFEKSIYANIANMESKELTPQRSIARWLQSVMDSKGWTPPDWHKASGVAASTIQRAVRPDYQFITSTKTLRTLAEAAGVALPNFAEISQNRDSAQSAYGTTLSDHVRTSSKKIPLQSLRVTHRVPALGKVEAGAWREMVEEFVDENTEYVDCELPEYKGVEAFCNWVVGESINRLIKPGGKVVWIRAEDAIGGLQQGDYVMVRAPKGATGLFECTVKRLFVRPDGDWELRPESDDPQWQTPYVIPPRIEAAQEGIEIYGVVVDWRPPKLQRSGVPAKERASA